MPTSQSCGELFDAEPRVGLSWSDSRFSSRPRHDQLIGRIIRRVEVNLVETVEDDDGKPPQAFVAVGQRMVPDE